jgi:hypothetical protein
MENLTIVGMKDLNQRLARIERSLESIAKSLETLVKIQNKQIPTKRLVTGWDPVNGMDIHLEDNDEEED